MHSLLLALLLTQVQPPSSVPPCPGPNTAIGTSSTVSRTPICKSITGTADGGAPLTQVLAVSPLVSDGGTISFPLYQTTATLSLFLDPAGNDSNSCTSSGAANACLTWAGITAKVPRFQPNNVTVVAAAGSYTGGVDFGQVFVGGTYSLTGTLITATPATGSATGTTTAISNSTTGESVITDGAATWTVNDFRGKFVLIGGNTMVVTSNTATTMNVIGSTGVASPQAYTVQTTGVNFSSGLIFTNPLTFARPLSTTAVINVTGIGFAGAVSVSTSTRVALDKIRVISAAGGIGAIANTPGAIFQVTNSYIQSATAGSAANSFQGMSQLGFSQSYFRSTTSGGVAISGFGTYSSAPFEVEAATANNTNPLLVWNGNYRPVSINSSARQIVVKCASASTQAAVAFRGPFASTSLSELSVGTGFAAQLGPISVTNCAVGVDVSGSGAIVGTEQIVSTSCTTAINVSNGGQLRSTTLPTQTGATSELLIDGNAYLFADINGQTSKAITFYSTLSNFAIGAQSSAVGGAMSRGVQMVPYQNSTLPTTPVVGALVGDGDGGLYVGQTDGGFQPVVMSYVAPWFTQCPAGSSCTNDTTASFLGWYRPSVLEIKQYGTQMICNAISAGTGTDNVNIVVSDGSGALATCSVPCSLARTGVRFTVGNCSGGIPFPLTSAKDYRLYYTLDSNCTVPPSGLACTISISPRAGL